MNYLLHDKIYLRDMCRYGGSINNIIHKGANIFDIHITVSYDNEDNKKLTMSYPYCLSTLLQGDSRRNCQNAL